MQHELNLPPSSGDLPFNKPKMTQCAHCGDWTSEPVIKQYYDHRCVQVENFCSHTCHHQWYVNRLRSFGL